MVFSGRSLDEEQGGGEEEEEDEDEEERAGGVLLDGTLAALMSFVLHWTLRVQLKGGLCVSRLEVIVVSGAETSRHLDVIIPLRGGASSLAGVSSDASLRANNRIPFFCSMQFVGRLKIFLHRKFTPIKNEKLKYKY